MSKEIFIKYYFDDDNILFYFHYKDDWAVRQIEIKEGEIKKMDAKNREEFLQMTDQPIEEEMIEPEYYITKEEFEKVWNNL